MKQLFVTGTDTGVGKTFVTAAIARRARALGKKVFAFKPIETGCDLVGERRIGPDQELISEAAGNWQTGEQRGLYQLSRPVAPWVAAQIDGVQIDMEKIAATARSVPDAQLVVVEGAGGWRVPITEAEDMSHLARRLGGEVVIAARAGLGTINHSVLTIEAVERDGLRIAALVLSRRPDEDPEFVSSNREQIRRYWKGNVLVLDTDAAELDALIR